MLRRRKKTLVGLDIGSSAVKVVELGRRGGRPTLVAAGCEPLPPDAIVDHAIVHGDVIAGAIKRAFRQAGIKTREVAVAMSGSAVIVKTIALPKMPEAELEGTIHWEARQHIPYDTQTVNLDFHVLGPSFEPSDVDVLLAAAKKDRVDEFTQVVSEAGCVPRVLDVDAFALQNAYELTHGERADRVDVLINVGASVVNLNIVQGSRFVFTRDLSIGGNAYSEAIQRELGVDFDQADLLKRGAAVTGANYITVDRYRVEYQRSDGRQNPGVDVPYAFDGAMTFTTAEGVHAAEFVLVRASAKLEAPLVALAGGGGAIVINTLAVVTFYGHDQTGEEISATGTIGVNFADWDDGAGAGSGA